MSKETMGSTKCRYWLAVKVTLVHVVYIACFHFNLKICISIKTCLCTQLQKPIIALQYLTTKESIESRLQKKNKSNFICTVYMYICELAVLLHIFCHCSIVYPLWARLKPWVVQVNKQCSTSWISNTIYKVSELFLDAQKDILKY